MPGTNPQRDRQLATDWRMTGLLFVAIASASAALTGVLEELGWWLVVLLFVAVILAAPAITRSFSRREWLPPLATVVTYGFALTLFFAPETSVLGFFPTIETFERFPELFGEATESIATQGRPADATREIVFLLCLGIGAIAMVMDSFALGIRRVALAGVPLALLIMVPSIIDARIADPFFFALTALAYLAMLLAASRRSSPRAATALGAIALVGALLVPAALPAVEPTTGGGSNAVATGVNPIINLGNDLRRTAPVHALSYATDAETGVYLRLSTLDDFSGREWLPTAVDPIPGNTVDAIGAPPGLTGEIATTPIVTDIEVGDILGRWLPLPYPASSVTGLRGNWAWEPEGLSVRSDDSNMRGQEYQVASDLVQPTFVQLLAAGTTVEPGMGRYLGLPDSLPTIVSETALEVAGGLDTNYEKAVALQDFFTSGQFEYSEEAPVEFGFDGSGARILGDFLEVKAGYCVHFSSAMAAMARSLGIPARVVVGFTPGAEVLDEADQLVEYQVTTRDLHAWPELYFVGVGWVQFEPTPGRGFVPDFSVPDVDDPATPDVDESTSTATPAPTSTASPTGVPIDDELQFSPEGTQTQVSPVPWWLGALGALVLIALLPGSIRAGQRYLRFLTLARGGPAVAAWDELRATAADLGLSAPETETPRVLTAHLLERLDGEPAMRLSRVRHAVESEAFAGMAGTGVEVADVREILTGLRRSAGWRSRLRARLLPRSLVAAWLPVAAASGSPSVG